MGNETSGSAGIGISLVGRTNVTIRNMEITGFGCDIELVNSSKICIAGYNSTINEKGIILEDGSANNTIRGNNINGVLYTSVGIGLIYAEDNTIFENTIMNTNNGTSFAWSPEHFLLP